MAIADSPADLITIDKLLLMAYKRASLVPIEHGELSPEQLAHGRDVLNTFIEERAADGVTAWVHDFHELQLVTGEETYSLPTGILNLVDSGSHIRSDETDTNQTTGETPVTPISAAQWNSLSSKSATGTPSLYWVDRTAHTLQVRIWPVPESDSKIRFQVHRHLGSTASGNDNLDMNRFWNRYIILGVALDLAEDSNLDAEKIGKLRAERDRAWNWCQLYATSDQHINISLVNSSHRMTYR